MSKAVIQTYPYSGIEGWREHPVAVLRFVDPFRFDDDPDAVYLYESDIRMIVEWAAENGFSGTD